MKVADYQRFGLIDPTNEPSLPDDWVAYDPELPANRSTSLLKGFFRVADHDIIVEKNLVINFTENNENDLKIILDALDEYFKLDIDAVDGYPPVY